MLWEIVGKGGPFKGLPMTVRPRAAAPARADRAATRGPTLASPNRRRGTELAAREVGPASEC